MSSPMKDTYNIKIFNKISKKGLSVFPDNRYIFDSDCSSPDIILVRSEKLHDYKFSNDLLAIGRAGAGTNNIPVKTLTKLGIPVFNSPGANANAVKELVLTGILISARNIIQAHNYVKKLDGSEDEVNKSVESSKKDFVGFELPGKTLGVLGLGAIGVEVANMALNLGMKVIGYDPMMTVDRAWQLSSGVGHAKDLNELFSLSDIISLHVPSNEQTKGMVNKDLLSKMKNDSIILNFSRQEVVDKRSMINAVNSSLISKYVTDFPSPDYISNQNIICLPHLGASTSEAEENCAIMVCNNILDFIENGNVHFSVNFPEAKLSRKNNQRIVITNANVPNMVGQISTCLAKGGINIADLINISKDDVAVTIIDIDGKLSQSLMKNIMSISGILSVRLLPPLN